VVFGFGGVGVGDRLCLGGFGFWWGVVSAVGFWVCRVGVVVPGMGVVFLGFFGVALVCGGVGVGLCGCSLCCYGFLLWGGLWGVGGLFG